MAKLKAPETAGFNAGKACYSKQARVGDIVIDPEFSKVFAAQEKTREEITRKIRMYGYDKSQPLVVWKGENILLDGHTRLEAAKAAGLEEVPVTEMEFGSREDAMLYTFERQALRRNLTPAEILYAAQTLGAGRKERDGGGRAAEQLAERLGISAATVYQARKIWMEAPEKDLKAVQKGERSIAAVYRQVTKKKSPPAGKAEAQPPEENRAAAGSPPHGDLREIITKVAGVIDYIDRRAEADPPLREIRPALMIRLREIRAALKEKEEAKR
jgi:ParB family chromosome partitioning protein